LRQLEGRSLAGAGGKGKGTPKTEVYDKTRSNGAALAAAPKAYNTDGDVKIEKKKKKKAESSDDEEEVRLLPLLSVYESRSVYECHEISCGVLVAPLLKSGCGSID
jgi:hypothetical protein